MSDDTNIAEVDGAEQRQRSRRAPFLVAPAMIALVVGTLWIMRTPLAENLIERELAARNVHMRYDIASIGPRTQRIENVVLGDPNHPDLIARWVEVDISFAGFSPAIAAVRADGVRLHGSWLGGKLSLGELDRFMGQGESAETVLPDIRVGLSNTRAEIRTDYGPVGLDVSGQGHLRDNFKGRVALAMPSARAGDCAVASILANVAVSMRDGSPRLRGPVTANALACPAQGVAVAAPHFDLDARIDRRFSHIDGSGQWMAKAVRASGLTLGGVDGAVKLAASRETIEGTGRISGTSLSAAPVQAGRSELSLRFKGAMPAHQPMRADVDGTLAMQNITPRTEDPLANVAGAVVGTPFAPLVAKLTKAVHDAAGNNRFGTRLAAQVKGAHGSASLSDVHFAAQSGARADLSYGGRVTVDWPDHRWNLAGKFAIDGGGLPEASLTVRPGARGGASGTLVMASYRAKDARLALAPLRFDAAEDGSTHFATTVSLDGPLPDGAVKGLTVPVAGRLARNGGLLVNPACVPLRWQAVRLSTLALDPATLSLCPAEGGAMVRMAGGRTSGGAQVRDMSLAGRIGTSPLSLRAADLAVILSRPGFRASGVEARVGRDDAPVLLGAGSFGGQFAKGGIEGEFGAGHGRIGTVPLDLTDMAGRWKFAQGRLDVDGGLRISDVAPAARFHPVVSKDARLSLVNGRITAQGRLQHPTQGDPFARVDIGHDLSSGVGNARFALQNLHFGQALQPDDLTPLALGVVANVNGDVTGDGEIRWTGDKVTSTGRFSTQGMNLAAAFGPVEGLSTTVNFTDLLAMQTAPGQVATIKTVNPGVMVTDGRVRFQLLPGSRARIEDGEWPFAGGRLTLLPSTMDFDAKGARNLIFRVTGLDAGAFINTMELKNISATGTYDGLLPMVFDATGGRIVGGILVARQEGMPPLVVEDARNLTVTCDPMRQAGTLSYVGDVSNADMGTYGKMAFDALKRLRYKCLTILLDGAIDGEFVTRIAINGVNQGSDESRRSALLRSFLGIPFIFNVRIEAPFRGLLNTYQSFVDPSALVRGSLGPQYQTVLENRLAVQPPESDNSVSREGE